jgi:hypothetical protein
MEKKADNNIVVKIDVKLPTFSGKRRMVEEDERASGYPGNEDTTDGRER